MNFAKIRNILARIRNILGRYLGRYRPISTLAGLSMFGLAVGVSGCANNLEPGEKVMGNPYVGIDPATGKERQYGNSWPAVNGNQAKAVFEFPQGLDKNGIPQPPSTIETNGDTRADEVAKPVAAFGTTAGAILAPVSNIGSAFIYRGAAGQGNQVVNQVTAGANAGATAKASAVGQETKIPVNITQEGSGNSASVNTPSGGPVRPSGGGGYTSTGTTTTSCGCEQPNF